MIKMINKIKKILMLTLTLTITLAISTTSSLAAENPFSDLDNSNPSYNDILQLYGDGIFYGVTDTEFGPDQSLTRGMFVTLLGRISEKAGIFIPDAMSTVFGDVEPSSWYGKYVDWAYKKGIVSGTSDTTFHPDTMVTREQASAILIRFAQVTHLELKTDGYSPESMADFDQVSQWFTSDMRSALAAGLAIGADKGTLSPQTPASRGETATLLQTLRSEYIGSSLNLIEVINEYVPVIEGLPVNSYSPSGFTANADGSKSYNDGARSSTAGIDVSSYQGTIDWQAAKSAGIDFAIIRAGGRGYGSEGILYVDEQFDANMKGAADAGIKTGVYFFSQAITVNEAKEEAAFVIEKLKDYNITYPVVFDWETIAGAEARTDNMDGALLTDCAVAFMEGIKAAGYTPMFYANKSLAHLKYDLARLSSYPFWLAEYNDLPYYYYDFQIWQYSENGQVEGIEGPVDLNMSFLNY